MTATDFAGNITALSPLDGRAIDGKATPKTRRPRRTLAPAEAPEGDVYAGWECPSCEKPFPAHASQRHLIEHVNDLTEQRDALAAGKGGVHLEFDDLGNVLVYGPENGAEHPVVWLRFEDITVDASVQREEKSAHPLNRRGVEFDENLSEVISVAPIFAAESDGAGGEKHVLIGYRAVEGQHRVLVGQRQHSRKFHPCKIVAQDYTRQEESALARGISHGRAAFKAMDDWHSLRREGQPNVVAAAELLTRSGYLVMTTPPKTGQKAIAAAEALLRVAGVRWPRGRMGPPEVLKDPQEGTRDLTDVLLVLESMAREEQEGSESRARYGAILMSLVNSVIEDNRDVGIEVGRLARVVGIYTPAQWLARARDTNMGGRKYGRECICHAYNKGKRQDSESRIS